MQSIMINCTQEELENLLAVVYIKHHHGRPREAMRIFNAFVQRKAPTKCPGKAVSANVTNQLHYTEKQEGCQLVQLQKWNHTKKQDRIGGGR